jgi:hypothetical protein
MNTMKILRALAEHEIAQANLRNLDDLRRPFERAEGLLRLARG